MKFDYSKLTNVKVAGIDRKDYPQFCDAYIESADYEGRPMSESDLDELNKDGELIYSHVEEQLRYE